MEKSIDPPVKAMRLDNYTIGSYTPGAPYWKQLLWYFIGSPLFTSYWIPFSGFKTRLLSAFGAKIGQQVRIKPGVRIKFPWRVTIADHVWLGEGAWLDNLALITIESHVCISQGVYLCTGNHNWSDPNFSLITGSITIKEGSWIAAGAIVGPNVTIGRGAVLGLGSVTGKSLDPMTIYVGNPAQPIKKRHESVVQ